MRFAFRKANETAAKQLTEESGYYPNCCTTVFLVRRTMLSTKERRKNLALVVKAIGVLFMIRKTSTLIVLLTAVAAVPLHASDFPVANLPNFAHRFDVTMASGSGKNYILKSFDETLSPEMGPLTPTARKVTNQQALKQRLGVAVRLDDNNCNVR